jgi:hypothetical protein
MIKHKYFRFFFFSLIFLCADNWVLGSGIEKDFMIKNANTSDTIYTGQIQIHTSILEYPLQDAQVKFTLLDTNSQISTLVFEGSTNRNGDLIIEKLPIFDSFVGIADLKNPNNESLIRITNNGTASDHGIQIKLNLRSPIQGFVIDMQGRVIDEIYMSHNPFTNRHEGSWRASHQNTGTYIFYTQTAIQTIAGKINHVSNYPSQISNFKHLNSNQNQLKESSSESSKFIIEINSEVGETIEQTVYLSENESQEFNFSINHLPIADARIEGTVTMNQTVLAPNAKMEWSCLSSDDSFTIYTDANGYYHKDDVPIPIDEYFTNPEAARYYLTVHIGDSITFKVDPVYLISGELKTENHNINIL